MGKEIERKFLVTSAAYRDLARGVRYRQGYLSSAAERTVRVRTIDEKGFLTIKGITVGASRAEYEYEIPAAEADEMLANLCEKPLIEKDRYKVPFGGLLWEIDEFFGDNEGLVVAECELSSDDQKIEKPGWIGDEVTGDPRYYNANLARNPYRAWR